MNFLLAHVPIPDNLTIPRRVRFSSRERRIDIATEGVPFGADCWIMCRGAYPHEDRAGYGHPFLVTLSLTDGSSFGDIRQARAQWNTQAYPVPRGTLFVVDPRVAHWLMGSGTEDAVPWVGVQWEFPRRTAARRTRELVERLGGAWIPAGSSRYRSWRPKDCQG